MDPLHNILTRRSVRSFTSALPTCEIVKRILVAGESAPSANNLRPWKFQVIDQRNALDGLADFLPYGTPLRSAPCAILVCGRTLTDGKDDSWWPQGCSAAVQNILLAIHALGLGGVWLGLYPREERCQHVAKQFAISEPLKPFAIVALGWSAE